MSDPGVAARRAALDALRRIESGGAYANLVLGPVLERHGLGERDRHLATELVYGTTRMRRACDHLVDRFLTHPPDPSARAALRLGAYQLGFTQVPAHAAVSTTVAVTPKRARGLVNAVLRKVASTDVRWPDDATRLSYPDWVVQRLCADLGEQRALAALAAMDEAPTVHVRADGYVQDLASRWVAELVAAEPDQLVLDLCAGPGGKATAIAASGARVVAADLRPGRAGLVAANARRLGARLPVVVADAAAPPFAAGRAHHVLVDAPCSGLGSLRRRPDARWRIEEAAVERLAALQRRIVVAAAPLVAPGGVLTYSACTLTRSETLGVDEHLAAELPGWSALPPPGPPWEPHGRGALLLPQAAGTDGMALLQLRAPSSGHHPRQG